MIVVITDINIFDFGMGKGTYSYIKYINISCIRIFSTTFSFTLYMQADAP